MPSTRVSSVTTRLENLDLGPGRAAFALDGRTVVLAGPQHASSVAALERFYEPALADCYARAAALKRPSLFGRIRSWAAGFLSRLIGAPPVPTLSGREPGAPESPPPRGRTARGPKAPETGEGPQPARPSSEATVAEGAARGSRHGKSGPGPQSDRAPALMTVFADRAGVHVTWQLGGPRPRARAEPAKLELTYALDSDLGRRLQDCYTRLAELGYKVAGLEALAPEVEGKPAPAADPKLAAEAKAPSPQLRDEPSAAKIAEAAKAPEPAGPVHAKLPGPTSAKLQRLKLAAKEPRPPGPEFPLEPGGEAGTPEP